MSTSTEPGIARDDSGQPDRGLPGLLYGETEEELRAAVRGLLEERAAWSAVLARTETSELYDSALWRTLAAEVGCAGLLIPRPTVAPGASYRERRSSRKSAAGPRPSRTWAARWSPRPRALAVGDAELLSGLAGATVTAVPGRLRQQAAVPASVLVAEARAGADCRIAPPKPGATLQSQARLTG